MQDRAVRDDYAKVFNERTWQDLSKELYQAASDVAKVLVTR